MLFNRSRAIDVMEKEGVDGVVGTCIENISYFTNYFARPLRGVKTTQYYTVFSRHFPDRKALVLPSIRLPGYIADGFDVGEVYVYGKFSVERPEGTSDDLFAKKLAEGLRVDGRYENAFEALTAAMKDLRLLGGRPPSTNSIVRQRSGKG